ncbi:MAG: c-type cytochrome domain-containing protein, partial [Planctomycetaceae bacterium]
MCSVPSPSCVVRPALVLILAGLATAVRAEDPLLESDVLPILTKNCMGCHGGLRKQGGLDLRTVPAMLAGGESGPTIVAGD